MDEDWRRRVDRRREEIEQQRLHRLTHQEDATKPAGEKKLWEKTTITNLDPKRLAEMQKKYSCHICGVLASGPTHHPAYDASGYDTVHEDAWDDWNNPANLYKCGTCDKWACEDHIYIKGIGPGICQACGEKL